MSSNQGKSGPSGRKGTLFVDEGGDGERPGTSSSSQYGQNPQVQLVEEPNRDDSEGSTNNSAKERNTSRERPPMDPVERKRLKITTADDDDGIHMDTDDGSDSDDMDVEDLEGRLGAKDEGAVPLQEEVDVNVLTQATSKNDNDPDEDVSTTMQSSLRQRSLFAKGGTDFQQAQLGEAVASTSRAMTSLQGKPSGRTLAFNNLPVLEHGEETPPQDQVETPIRPRRETTPAAGTSANMDSLYFQKHEEIDENKDPEEVVQKLHGKQGSMWARKIFFLSTELVFPGFTALSDSKNQIPDYMGVRVRSSCTMQALLYADSLFFIMWILSFLSTCDILITVLKELHGYLSICLTCLFVIVNILRLRFGLKGNENDEVQYLALFWMTTVIVQIPLFTFIFLTDLFCPVLMAFTVTMDGAMMVFILLESIVGFIHFRSLLRDELNIIRMARRSKEASQSRANLSSGQEGHYSINPGDFGISKLEPVRNDWAVEDNDQSNSDEESENERSGGTHKRMDFRMEIQRLSTAQRSETNETNEDDDDSDSSEQVSSTSDAVRQRPIRAH